MTPRDEAVLADEVEGAAFIDLYGAAPTTLAAQLGLRVEHVAGATALVAARMPTTMFNRVIGLGLAQPARHDDVDRLRGIYRDAGVGTWWLHWNPFAAPADGPDWLAARGFTFPARRSWSKMLRASADPPHVATNLSVEPAADAEVAEVTAVIAQAFGMPPFMTGWLAALHGRSRWRVYSIADGAQVVGGACLFIGDNAGWLGMGAVQPTHRRRGGQGAAMARRIADAGAAGCAWAVTETGEAIGDEPNPSLANMRRTGFRCVASRLNLECSG